MSEISKEQQDVLDKQIAAWTEKLRELASKIQTARGVNCALVMITGTDAEYADIIPELILEDALRVHTHGWPQGFSVDLLNPSENG